jgi:hypothetical protein
MVGNLGSAKKSPRTLERSQKLQLIVGFGLIAIIFWLSLKGDIFVSAWDKEDSSFFAHAMDSLHQFQIHPSGTTIVLFWDKNCAECFENFDVLKDIPGKVRIYGVHTTGPSSRQKVQQLWTKATPHHAILLMDRMDLLSTSFRVRTTPSSYIILPKQKAIYSHVGSLKRSQRQMLRLLEQD